MTDNPAAMAFTWDAEAETLTAVPRFRRRAAETFTGGAAYWLSIEPQRSDKTHGHEFAWIKEAWKTLPESVADQYPSPEHLRKRALIDAGYYHETVIDAGTNAAAIRVAAAIRAMDDFRLVFVRGVFVIMREAKSQSYRAMGGKDFNASKRAILELISDMLGISPEQLSSAGQGAGGVRSAVRAA
jgi:hypothetical protein